MEGPARPDKIIEEIGGCGRYQIRISVVVHLIKSIAGFSILSTVIICSTPPWRCDDRIVLDNSTLCMILQNESEVNICPSEACVLTNDSKCSSFVFEGTLQTIVSEFGLVCGRDYIPSLIMTLQVAGLLAGNILAGQLSDLIGRKPPFFTSIILITVFNLVGFFSVSWVMFAVARIFVGIGSGFFLSTQYCLLSEFSLAKWRVWIVGFPSWPIEGCVFALCAWLIQDWRYIQLLTGIMGIPCLFAWFIIPESFRWYIGHDKTDKALEVINKVAKYNHRHEVELGHLMEKSEVKKYTVIDLFKSKTLIRNTILSIFNWMGLGLVSYGIKYGIQALSGNIFFNLFLFNLCGIPSKGIALWLQNRFGRRITAIICYTIVGISGFIVGVVQTVEAPNRDALTNGFALLAHIGITMAWGPVQTMTIELYPTVVRNIGFGTLSVMGRIGAMIVLS
ncbi:organic cation transporter protein-like [Mercenaria mercenaria]|uniref:organic cation transporter protein-like n=1 Tax=Mercenaria mercenaria TaxID=6596 RepID=UPI00234F8063|nr:organic cation transporter protein-like [Mercenaria mercenaria]